MPSVFNGESTFSSTSGARTTGFPYAKVWVWTPTTGCGNGSLDIAPKAQATIEKINWTSSKLKTFVHQRILSRKWNGKNTELKKIFVNHIIYKGLLSRIYKELLQFNNIMINIPIFLNGQKTWIDISPKKIYKWPICTWINVWCLLKRLNVELSDDLAIPLLGICPNELKRGTQTNSYVPMFIAELFRIA